MLQRHRLMRLIVASIAIAAALSAACDDDDDGEPTRPPTATAAASSTPVPSPSPPATVDPEVTPGPPARIELSAQPQTLVCDGSTPSIVTARVLDAAGRPVIDGTDVRFIVVALGSVDPVQAETSGGSAATEMTALAENAGVVVNVTSGDAQASIRVDCQ